VRTVVVGAGISGLVAARTVARRGLDPLVLESAPRAGGKVRSTRSEDGFLSEDGPSSFLARDPALVELIRDLGLESRLVPARADARRRFVAHERELHPVPAGPLALARSRLLPTGAKLRLFGDLLLPRGPAGHGDDETIAAFATRRLGPRAAERVFAPLATGIFAGDASSLSLPAALPALARLERDHRSLIVGAVREAVGGSGLFTFRDGVSELTEALARELGPRLRTGVSLLEIERAAHGFTLHLERNGRREALEADAVVLAVPADAASRALAALDPDASDALGAIPYAPVAIVDLGWRTAPRPVGGYGFLVARDERSALMGCLFPSTAFDGRANPGGLLVSARLGGALRPGLARASDETLHAIVMGELRRYLGLEGAPDFVRIIRHERALPQYVLGHRERVEAALAAEARHPGLHFAGNALRGLGIPDCVREATRVGRLVGA
jgi:oxygen-dependent protoporphyrinogen oxidase